MMNIVKYLLKPKMVMQGSNHYQSKKWIFEFKQQKNEREIRTVLLSFDINKQRL